jgi:hypothetical protein
MVVARTQRRVSDLLSSTSCLQRSPVGCSSTSWGRCVCCCRASKSTILTMAGLSSPTPAHGLGLGLSTYHSSRPMLLYSGDSVNNGLTQVMTRRHQAPGRTFSRNLGSGLQHLGFVQLYAVLIPNAYQLLQVSCCRPFDK